MNSLKLATPSRTMSSMSSRPAVAQIGDDHVQAVVDAGFAFGLLPPGVEGIAHLRAFGLDGEIDDGGGAAERRGAGAGFEIVGGGGAAEGHVEMGVDVDAAGHHEHVRWRRSRGRRLRAGCSGAMSWMRSPSMRMSAPKVWRAVTTVPLRISRCSCRCSHWVIGGALLPAFEGQAGCRPAPW